MRSKSWKSQLTRVLRFFGDIPVGKITTAHVQHFYNLTESHTSVSTANRHLTLVKAIFNKALSWGDFFGTNPCNGVKKKREPNHRLRYLSEAEIKALLCVAHPRLQPLLVCALCTGMRKGEILKLDWRDIDFASNTIQILETKSGKARKIPMMQVLRDMLLGIGIAPAGKVFELPEIMLRRYFAKALADARIIQFRFHDLRHSFASHFAMKTGDLPTLQQILWHASIQMTMRYAHLSDRHMAQKMAQLEGALPAINYAPQHSSRAPLGAPPIIGNAENVVE